MNLKHISKWISQNDMESILCNEKIKSWLLEQGPITERIKSKHKFELKLLRDSVGEVDINERYFLNNIDSEVKVREVILLADKNPLVFARSLIPKVTIQNGLKKLGELNTKPLGDILFDEGVFKKDQVVFSTFSQNNKEYWGRKAKYYVKNYPLSVMEIFLIQ